jgi:hypothetical protein
VRTAIQGFSDGVKKGIEAGELDAVIMAAARKTEPTTQTARDIDETRKNERTA